jgi:DNA repair protein RecN (Recombination protein N)
MLRSLSIRNLVLIDRLDLEFSAGLCALTGETGAGKSILLDALGIALGARAETGLVRRGEQQASVTLVFDQPRGSAAHALLEAQGLPTDDDLIVRRVLGSDGRSKAFINDAPVSVASLRALGACLIEIAGQDDAGGLLDPATHRALLDAFGAHQGLIDQVGAAYDSWQAARAEAEAARTALAGARRDEEYLRHAYDELSSLAPKPGEEQGLADQRSRLQHRQKIAEALAAAETELEAGGGSALRLRAAERHLARVAPHAGGALDQTLAALEQAALEADEAVANVRQAVRALELNPHGLEAIEERLFALRAAARKHQTTVEGLPALCNALAEQLAALDDDGTRTEALEKASAAAAVRFLSAAQTLGQARRKAAGALDGALARELKPLKLGGARFQTEIEALPEADAGRGGLERVRFTVATLPDAPLGALQKIASGGERARFLLALKLCLARASGVPTVLFDEVDAGVGGAVADAVGERLAKLAQSVQVLVITHSPQVAARAEAHFRVVRRDAGGQASARVELLAADARREEIARMLAGARITEEARAAAASLLAGSGR